MYTLIIEDFNTTVGKVQTTENQKHNGKDGTGHRNERENLQKEFLNEK